MWERTITIGSGGKTFNSTGIKVCFFSIFFYQVIIIFVYLFVDGMDVWTSRVDKTLPSCPPEQRLRLSNVYAGTFVIINFHLSIIVNF
jgi:hypothetical protein